MFHMHDFNEFICLFFATLHFPAAFRFIHFYYFIHFIKYEFSLNPSFSSWGPSTAVIKPLQ